MKDAMAVGRLGGVASHWEPRELDSRRVWEVGAGGHKGGTLKRSLSPGWREIGRREKTSWKEGSKQG